MPLGSQTLKGRTALITGSGRGIGAATARLFASEGARVVLTSRTSSELETVKREITSAGGSALAIPCDISDEPAVRSLFAQARKAMGPIDILINNAATFVRAELTEHSAEDFDRVFAVNVRGTFLCCREAFRDFKTKPGVIVNLSSLSGIRGTEKFPGLSSYSASKFAVVGLTESLAAEARALGARVCCVAPGAVDTEMLRKAAPQLRTRTTPDDIARILLSVCDESRSSALNGAVIEVFSNL